MNQYIILNSDNSKVRVMAFHEGVDIGDHIKKAVLDMYASSGNKSETYHVHRMDRKLIEYVINRETITTIKEELKR